MVTKGYVFDAKTDETYRHSIKVTSPLHPRTPDRLIYAAHRVPYPFAGACVVLTTVRSCEGSRA